MDKVDDNDNNTVDDWDMHHPKKRIKVFFNILLPWQLQSMTNACYFGINKLSPLFLLNLLIY